MRPATFRTPAPHGLRAADGSTLLVLPEDTRLRDRYRVHFLEAGGMSVTYRARDESCQYLIKEVSSLDSDRVIALNREKFLLERLDHPGIVKVHDLFEEDGYYYLVLEYVEGPRLDRLISPFPDSFLQEEVVVDWAVQLCDIFEYLHHQKPPVIYRDLKPKNVMKTPEGRIRLIDFGIARVYKEGQTRDTSPMGTALTASPEHYGGKQTDARSDIYTLGATLHFLLTNGRNPAPEPFAFTSVRALNPKLTPAIERLVQKAVEVRPEDRYQSARELKQALLSLRAPSLERPPRPPEDGGWSGLVPPARVPAAAPNWLAHLLVGVLVVGAVLAWFGSGRPTEVAAGPSPSPTRNYPGVFPDDPPPQPSESPEAALESPEEEEPLAEEPPEDVGVSEPEPLPASPSPRPRRAGPSGRRLPGAAYPAGRKVSAVPTRAPRTVARPAEPLPATPEPLAAPTPEPTSLGRLELPGYKGWSIVPPDGYELVERKDDELLMTASTPARSLHFVSREVVVSDPAAEVRRRIQRWQEEGWTVAENDFHGRPGYLVTRRGVYCYRELYIDPLPNGRCWLRQMEFEHHGRSDQAHAEWSRIFYSAIQGVPGTGPLLTPPE